MRTRITTLTVAGALAVAGGAGYVIGAGGDDAAVAQSPAAKSGSSAQPMMTSRRSRMSGGSMSAEAMGPGHARMMHDPAMREMHRTMDGEHAKMMRDPAMRQMHRTMDGEHGKRMRDGKMRRQHERAMRECREMARMMREHMED